MKIILDILVFTIVTFYIFFITCSFMSFNQTFMIVANNNIFSLPTGLERLFSLESLDLCNNLISEVQEISRLTGLPNLEILWLQGNPLTEDSDHRITVLSLFEEDHIPVKLDGREMVRSEGMKV